jgi:hypothetical protein
MKPTHHAFYPTIEAELATIEAQAATWQVQSKFRSNVQHRRCDKERRRLVDLAQQAMKFAADARVRMLK